MKQPPAILFVDHAPALGGAERSLLQLMQHLPRDHWTIRLAGVNGPLLQAAQDHDIITHTVTLPRLRRSGRFLYDWRDGARELSALARTTGAAAMYANTVRAAMYASLAARWSGIPFIWHMRDFWLSEDRPTIPVVDKAGKWLLAAAAKRIIVNSRAVQRHLPFQSKVAVVYNGVHASEFDPSLSHSQFRAKHDIPPQAPVVGMVGRLRPWKGQARFLRVAARVARQNEDTYFVVVGGSPFQVADDYPRQLQRLVEALGLDSRVRFTGHLDHVRPALAAMTIFVHPGDPEPFGLVNVEAMAMGKPVVAFDHGALPEIVQHNVTGLLVPPGNERAMTNAIRSLLQDAEFAHTLGQAGRRRVQQHFTVTHMAGSIDRLLAEVVDSAQHL